MHYGFIPTDVYDTEYTPQINELEATVGIDSTVSLNSMSYATASWTCNKKVDNQIRVMLLFFD
jgi:hypothetical protein